MLEVADLLRDPFIINTIVLSVLFIFTLVGYFFSQRKVNNKVSELSDVSAGLKLEEQGTTAKSSDGGTDKVLNPAVFKKFTVLKITKISYNTKLIRFEIPHGKPLGLSIGRHITLRAEIDGNNVMRAYTPTSRPDQTGYFDLLIKSYEFGKLSTYLHSLKVGQGVEVRGPVGRFKYEKNSFRRIGLIAGGTGLTPCLQVIRCVLESPEYSSGDLTQFTLLFQNRTEDDILLKDELEKLEKSYRDRLAVYYYLSNPGTEEFGTGNRTNEKRGYIKAADISEFMSPEICPYTCICGPSGFNEKMKMLLVEAGHEAEKTVYVW